MLPSLAGISRLIATKPRHFIAYVGLLIFAGAVPVHADAYHITPAERAACMSDAERLCSSAYPDEGKMIVCMQANEKSLTASCSVVFKAGMRKRGLN